MFELEILLDLSALDPLLKQLHIALLLDKLSLHVVEPLLELPPRLLQRPDLVVIDGLHVVEGQVKGTLRIMLRLLQTLVVELLLVPQLQLIVLGEAKPQVV